MRKWHPLEWDRLEFYHDAFQSAADIYGVSCMYMLQVKMKFRLKFLTLVASRAPLSPSPNS